MNQFSRLFPTFMLVVFLFSAISCSSEKQKARRNLTVAFYNVENLFDLENEPGKQDGEFTPEGSKNWTTERYQKKVDDIARVLASISENDLPEIIGLCEVENQEVLHDLIENKNLAKENYGIVHHESPDFRGIDCALLFRTDEFKVTTHFPVAISFKNEPDYKTRDILYVKGKTKNREEFHIFVNHWPSRIGGLEQTEPSRVEVAGILKSKIDSIVNVDENSKIIVLGDMNDEPDNISLSEILGAKSSENSSAGLVNLMYPDDEKNLGSYYYRGNWNMLDNLVVSTNLLDEKGFSCVDKKGFVFQQEWMQYKNKNGETSPNRTYGGPNYYGGVSDHFPVYFKLSR